MKMSNDIHNKIADALASVGLKLSDGYTRAALLLKMKGSVSLNFAVDGKPVTAPKDTLTAMTMMVAPYGHISLPAALKANA